MVNSIVHTVCTVSLYHGDHVEGERSSFTISLLEAQTSTADPIDLFFFLDPQEVSNRSDQKCTDGKCEEDIYFRYAFKRGLLSAFLHMTDCIALEGSYTQDVCSR